MSFRRQLILFLALAIAIFLYLGFAKNLEGELAPVPSASSTSVPVATEISSPSVLVNGRLVRVEVATTTAAVRKGLSGRLRLEEDEGMLFIFPVADVYRFWMPDMRFSIDIIWIRDGRVVDITRNASEDFDPASPVFYSPKVKAKEVLEVNAGFAARNGLEIGDEVVLRTIF